MTRTNHTERAEARLAAAWDVRDVTTGLCDSYTRMAQAHATLALVEQQRIANLLACSHLRDHDDNPFGIDPEIRRVLWGEE